MSKKFIICAFCLLLIIIQNSPTVHISLTLSLLVAHHKKSICPYDNYRIYIYLPYSQSFAHHVYYDKDTNRTLQI